MGFLNIHLLQNSKKIEGGPLMGKKFSEKVAQYVLVSHMVLYVTQKKKEKLFWFSSLGQQVQFKSS